MNDNDIEAVVDERIATRALAAAVIVKIRSDGYLPDAYCAAVTAQIEALGR